jgi:hypothetical protein
MPFFRNDPRLSNSRGDTDSPRRLLPLSSENPGTSDTRISTASSGVLGPGLDVDPDTEDDFDEDESTTTSSSSFDQLVRSVSLVRRGQAQMIRNPSSRRSIIPEVFVFILHC